MRVPYSWLKEYVHVELDPEKLAHRLTMVGLEVDRVDYLWPGIVTAEITWLERIKGSDHLQATRVTTGTEEFSVVCGAPNIKLHDRVPLAQLGAKVGDIVINPKKTFGVVSEGMLCSPRELGISDDHSGILILPQDTPLGVPLGKVLADAVIELDIKAHRGDLFCMTGVAREVAAFTGEKLKMPDVHLTEKGTPASELMRLEVRDAVLCPRYTARVIRGVKIGPSPQWMVDRLVAAGMRPINAVVDVTNYVMLELGEPLHAFDYDKVAEHTIIVRRAEPGETITTLDGVERKLTSDMLLITDPAGPNVIAGVFGGERVEVSTETTSILLEAAHFNPVNVRRTSVALGLRTESSGRFEKNPDIELTALAIDRAAQLIVELAGGEVAPGRVDFYPEPVQPRALDFKLSQTEWLTGMRVTREESVRALESLGFGVSGRKNSDVVRVTIPTWRHDVQEGADVVEEVARIVGYDRIPSIMPTGPVPEPARDSWFAREEMLREVLVGAGLTEVLTYSLTSVSAQARLFASDGQTSLHALAAPTLLESDVAETQAADGSVSAVTLVNPLSSELEILRLTLLPGLLDVMRENAKHSDAGLWFFELARRYLPMDGLETGSSLADERRTVGIAASGPLARGWSEPDRDADFFDLKGIIETLLESLKIVGYSFTAATHPSFQPGRCAALAVVPAGGIDNKPSVTVGVLGEIHPAVRERFELAGRVYAAELDLERLYSAVPAHIVHQPVPRYPAAQRDLAIIVRQDVAAVAIEETIRSAGAPLLRDVRLFDVYTGESIPDGMRSMAYALSYQSPERTLTDQEVDRAHAAIVRALEERFSAALRS